MADQAGVSYAPTDDQELIRSTARRFLSQEVGLERVRDLMMSEDGFDLGIWKEMAGLGFTGLAIAADHGGAGLGMVELSVLLEEMGRLVTPGPFFASAVLGTLTIADVATPAQQAELLPGLAAGETIVTLAAFEQARGWDIGDAMTAAVGGAISGQKRSVLDGHLADIILVTASDEDGLGVYVVERDAPGVDVSQERVLDPTRRQASITFDNTPATRLGVGDATPALGRVMLLAVAALANEQVGGAQACLDMAVGYAKSRHQFGRPIGSYQAIKHRCATMLVQVEQARSAAYHAVRVTEDPEELAIAAPLAGSVASEAYLWAAGENIQVHGGIGFTWEHDAHLYLKRAKTSSLLLGSPGHQRHLMGQALGI